MKNKTNFPTFAQSRNAQLQDQQNLFCISKFFTCKNKSFRKLVTHGAINFSFPVDQYILTFFLFLQKQLLSHTFKQIYFVLLAIQLLKETIWPVPLKQVFTSTEVLYYSPWVLYKHTALSFSLHVFM